MNSNNNKGVREVLTECILFFISKIHVHFVQVLLGMLITKLLVKRANFLAGEVVKEAKYLRILSIT